MATLEMMVGLCSAFRVTVNDGGSREEIHCLATDEGSLRRRMEELGYMSTSIERVPPQEFLGDSSYAHAEMWALHHRKIGEPQVDCYPTSGSFAPRMRY